MKIKFLARDVSGQITNEGMRFVVTKTQPSEKLHSILPALHFFLSQPASMLL